DRSIGKGHPPGFLVRVGVDSHGFPPLRMRGTDDPQGDLAPVGHQDTRTADGHSRLATSWPTLTSSSSSTRNSFRVPACVALSSVKLFITSTRPIVWPSAMTSPSRTYSSWSGAGRR